mmetsp:Transcript_56884/g.130220  ORF Transcript_56884/g.130220 Transcript_56884/m.130220 type:complete len:216 (-) Transcript_56884:955-1602(-)
MYCPSAHWWQNPGSAQSVERGCLKSPGYHGSWVVLAARFADSIALRGPNSRRYSSIRARFRRACSSLRGLSAVSSSSTLRAPALQEALHPSSAHFSKHNSFSPFAVAPAAWALALTAASACCFLRFRPLPPPRAIDRARLGENPTALFGKRSASAASQSGELTPSWQPGKGVQGRTKDETLTASWRSERGSTRPKASARFWSIAFCRESRRRLVA